ncbi:unnamed protein product [Paramecium pentaurelia]|uniref:PPM-type phosphatase domain-containing protein n=1 Tax=Paramecium pentaurelia TaxID=43138 RepID=A0A8S1TXT0_9CILI|nr:unnamed protein product [Paramecium pentaurelia]
MKQQQQLKGIPNIRSQYYVAAQALNSQLSSKISKTKSSYIDDSNKMKDYSYFQLSTQKTQPKCTAKRVNVSLDQPKQDDSTVLPPLRKEILRSRQSQPTVTKSKQQQRNNSPLLPLESLPVIEPSKISQKNIGIISAYAANTHQGLVRQYNEDRVSIILNLMRPNSNVNQGYWPQSSFFAVYDGHGGPQCADFMRDNLHQYIIKEDCFPNNPKLAIERGVSKAEKTYLEMADQKVLDKSGCCAVFALFVDNNCYVANIGDSRAIISQGGKGKSITVDHKPSTQEEQQRINKFGGQIYQTQLQQLNGEIQLGPHRVLPGRLAVSRTFGDAEAKLTKYGGIPNVISSEPDIFQLQITDQDFLILACDGIYDKMSTEEVIQCAWNVQTSNIHIFGGKAVEAIMRLSLQRKTFDNITAVFIGFPQLEKKLKNKSQIQQ